MEQQINDALQEIRPALALHAGDAELVKFEDGTAYLRLLGSCHGCPLSQVTLKMGIEEHLRSRVTGVERVEAV